MLDAVLRDWELTPDGAGGPGGVPVRDAAGAALFLAVAGSEHEHLVLQHWHGRGAVRLHRADPHRRALLLDRLGNDLAAVPDDVACRIVVGLYGALHVPPMPQLPQQAQLVGARVEELTRDARSVPVPRRLVEQAVALAGELTAGPATAVLHGDLHYRTVRQGPAGDWLAVAPRPLDGDPHSELEPMLRHRFAEYGGTVNSVRDDIRYRFYVLFDTAGLDEQRARDWVIVRSVLTAHRAFQDGRPDARELITRCVTVAKAVQG